MKQTRLMIDRRRLLSSLVNSGNTGPKLTKFLSDVEKSSPVLTRPSALRSSNHLWNTGAKNEVAEASFRRSVRKLVITATTLERSRNKGQIDHMQSIIFQPILKIWRRSIGRVHSQIIGLLGDC